MLYLSLAAIWYGIGVLGSALFVSYMWHRHREPVTKCAFVVGGWLSLGGACTLLAVMIGIVLAERGHFERLPAKTPA